MDFIEWIKGAHPDVWKEYIGQKRRKNGRGYKLRNIVRQHPEVYPQWRAVKVILEAMEKEERAEYMSLTSFPDPPGLAGYTMAVTDGPTSKWVSDGKAWSPVK